MSFEVSKMKFINSKISPFCPDSQKLRLARLIRSYRPARAAEAGYEKIYGKSDPCFNYFFFQQTLVDLGVVGPSHTTSTFKTMSSEDVFQEEEENDIEESDEDEEEEEDDGKDKAEEKEKLLQDAPKKSSSFSHDFKKLSSQEFGKKSGSSKETKSSSSATSSSSTSQSKDSKDKKIGDHGNAI